MMHKGRDIVGKKVVTKDTGTVLDNGVKDIFFDGVHNRVLGFLVNEGGMFSDALVIRFEDVESFGTDALIVSSPDVVMRGDEAEDISAYINEQNVAVGTRVMTESGKDLGAIRDIYFNDMTGVIEGYEVTGGIFSDAYSGRSFLPAPSAFRIGENVAFVPDETEALMEEQVGGIKGAAQVASDKASQALDSAKETINETAENAQAKIDSAVDSAQSSASSYASAASVDEAKGRRVRQDVRSQSGALLAASGQIVSASLIQLAKEDGREQELLAAVNLSEADALKLKASSSANDAADVVGKGVATLRSKISELWASAKENAGSVKQSVTEKTEEMAISSAVGTKATRTILSKNDDIILNEGDMITYESIEKARAEGVLDVLLSSVSS